MHPALALTPLAAALTGATSYETVCSPLTARGTVRDAVSVTRQASPYAFHGDRPRGVGTIAEARSQTRGSRFAGVVAGLLEGRVLRRSWLVRFDFASGTRRYWLGFGRLYAGSEYWEGLSRPDGKGGLVSLADLDLSPGTDQQPVTLTLSGVSPAALFALTNHATEVRNRRVVLYQQWFDEAWQPIGDPYARWAGTGDKLTGRRAAGKASVTLTAENILVAKYLPANGMYTDRDQQARFPGDRGLERMALNEDHQIAFP